MIEIQRLKYKVNENEDPIQWKLKILSSMDRSSYECNKWKGIVLAQGDENYLFENYNRYERDEEISTYVSQNYFFKRV